MEMQQRRKPSGDGWDRVGADAPAIMVRRTQERTARERELGKVATSQTIRKLRRDVIESWHEKGTLGDGQLQAGKDILRVWEAITRGLSARTQAWEQHIGGSGLVENWPASLRRAYASRYAPWSAEAGLMMVVGSISAKDLVLAAVVDNATPAHLAKRFGLDRRPAIRAVQASLYRYADLAGWISGEPTGETAEAVSSLNRLRERMTAPAAGLAVGSANPR